MAFPIREVTTIFVGPIVARHWPDGEFGWGGISVKL